MRGYLFVLVICMSVSCSSPPFEESRVVIDSDGWQLVGDLTLPTGGNSVRAVLLLNQAAGDRTPYDNLARQLAFRGIASLRMDMRGHGESVNLGKFVPGEQRRDPLIWESQPDVKAAHEFLSNHELVDSNRVAIVGSSYSGEEMAEAGRVFGFAQAYVALSPGSFSDESITAIDSSGVPWLFVATAEDTYLMEIVSSLREQTSLPTYLLLPGRTHATDMLDEFPSLAEHIAIWLSEQL